MKNLLNHLSRIIAGLIVFIIGYWFVHWMHLGWMDKIFEVGAFIVIYITGYAIEMFVTKKRK
jgi:hypothetical protein